MNGPPRAALDPIIEPVDSPMYWPGFYDFKTPNYGLQKQLMSKKAPQTKKSAAKTKRAPNKNNVPETEKSSSQKVAHMFTWLIRHPKNRKRGIYLEFFF